MNALFSPRAIVGVVALLCAATGCAHLAPPAHPAAAIPLTPYLDVVPSLQVQTDGHLGTFLLGR